VEHLLAFSNAHGARQPAATVRPALNTAQSANGRPGIPGLSVLEEIDIVI
jgi:hypothetical protein